MPGVEKVSRDVNRGDIKFVGKSPGELNTVGGKTLNRYVLGSVMTEGSVESKLMKNKHGLERLF